ncbi:MFS transporter [Paenalkalicoccus suaedae]|uniref:MFS transporter n=1 Tax=Paenalkalicoccus suaedae TaxID=2592382 RepID=A0A859FBK8_9BACI|nr:MFS transporter [Paenalkalicoccus suaedae]QKS70340.1 MFS transporter [Paenalkalicoccus suaedae]
MHNQLKLLLGGRVSTNVIDSFYFIAAVWYVTVETNSPLLIGVTGAVQALPVVLSFILGPIIDRYQKRTILIVSIGVQSIAVLSIAGTYYASSLSVPFLLVMLFIAQLASVSMRITEQTMIRRWTIDEDLTKVNGYFAFSYQTVDIIGDALAGFAVALVGIGVIFSLSTVTLIGVGLLFAVWLKHDHKKSKTTYASFLNTYRRDFLQGAKVVIGRRRLLAIFAGIVLMNVSGAMGLAVLPAIASGADQYGLWLLATSIGMLVGSLLAKRVADVPIRWLFSALGMFVGIAWIVAFSLPISFLSFVLFGVAWVGIGMFGVYLPTLIQVNIPEEYIGVGFSFLTAFLGCLSPAAFVLGGVIGEWLHPLIVLQISGVGYILFSAYMWIHPSLRRLENRVEELLE